jgi:hypothetical protein
VIRKLFIAAALSALPAGFFAILGAGSAQAASPVTFKGSISCSLTGTATFKPPLSNSQTSKSTKVTFKGTNNHCKGVKGTKLTQHGETLKSSKDSFSATLPANSGGSCADLASGTVPATTMRVKWIGTSPITSTKIAFPAGTLSISNGLIEYLNGKSTGSFAGTGQTAVQATKISEPNGKTLSYSAANAEAACAGPGISDLTLSQPNPEPAPFSKNDNLEVGRAY